MRPLTVLILIVGGSAVALAISLSMSGVVFLLLPEYSARLASEKWPLIKGLLWSWSLVGAAVLSLIGELRDRRWRWAPQLTLAGLVAALAVTYWP